MRNGHDPYDEEAPPDLHSASTSIQSEEESYEETQEEVNYKSDITVTASERLKSSMKNSLQKISDRLLGMSDRDEEGGGSLYCPKKCAICLEPYKVGDEICWSKNEKCSHAFHLDCMSEWLMENDDCPLCRENYLNDDST